MYSKNRIFYIVRMLADNWNRDVYIQAKTKMCERNFYEAFIIFYMKTKSQLVNSTFIQNFVTDFVLIHCNYAICNMD